MFRNMVTSLFKYERIRTTEAKAKALRGWADHLVTLAKRGDLHARRQALAIAREKSVVHKLFAEAADKFGSISGGYTRVIKLGQRPGDAAPMAIIELVPQSQRSGAKSAAPKKAETKQPAAPKPSVATEPAAVEPQLESVEGEKPVEEAVAAPESGDDAPGEAAAPEGEVRPETADATDQTEATPGAPPEVTETEGKKEE
jgi:large subunit ribosomal protein L17